MGKPSFADVIAQMEKKKVGTFCFEPGCVEPGCDTYDVPLRHILRNLEK